MDGEVIIDVTASTDKFDRQIDKLTRKKGKKEVEIEITTKNINQLTDELKNAEDSYKTFQREVKDINKEYERYLELSEKANNLGLDSLTTEEVGELEGYDFMHLGEMYDEINEKELKHKEGITQITNELNKQEQKLNEQKGQYSDILFEISEIQKQQEAGKLDGIKSAIDKIGKSTEKTIKKVGRWALAIFGIRSAYLMVRKAASTISQYDEQVKADLQYIQVALASVLEPVIKRIIDLVYKLLQYLQIIIYQWTGKNIFANANKTLSKMTGSAKELKKQLAGFDEMNILSDSSSGGGATNPSFDLSKIQGKVPEWLDWIIKNRDLLFAIIDGILAGIIAIKLGFSSIQALGIGVAIAGIIYAILSLIEFLKDPTFENFIKILEGIAVAVIGVAVAIGAWPVAVGAAVALVVIEIVKHFDEIKALFQKGIDWLDKNVLGGLRNLFGPLGNILYVPIKYFVELAKGAFESFYGGIKKIIDGVVKIFKGDFWGGIKDIFGGLLSVMTAPLQGFLKAVKSVIPLVLGFFSEMWGYLKDIGAKAGQVISSSFKAVVNSVLWAVENILNTPINAINGLIGIINKVPGINLGYLSTFNLPRLAKGTILNAPGKGVPVAGGSAIAGEAGREAYLPLSDTQLLEELGSTIGKYININATIPVYMGNRQVVREFRKISAEDDFAYNR